MTPFKIKLSAEGGPTELHLSGGVGDSWEGFTARSLIDAVTAAKPTSLKIFINSGGGDAFAGVEIYNFLKAQTIPVEAVVTGLAASAASVIAMGAKTVKMAAGSLLMIHNPSGGQWGEAADMRKTADVLDKLAGELAAIYAAKTGKPSAEMLALMDAETWMTGAEALAAGFVDSVDGEALALAPAAFAGANFRNAPKVVQLLADPVGLFSAALRCDATPAAILAELDSIQKGQEEAAERLAGITADLGKTSAALGSAEAEIAALKAKIAANPNPNAVAAKIVASMAIPPVSAVESEGKTGPNADSAKEIYAAYKSITNAEDRFKFFQRHSEALLKSLK